MLIERDAGEEVSHQSSRLHGDPCSVRTVSVWGSVNDLGGVKLIKDLFLQLFLIFIFYNDYGYWKNVALTLRIHNTIINILFVTETVFVHV